MFGFLKDKLKGALKVFSKGVEEKGKTESKTVEIEEVAHKPKPLEQSKVVSTSTSAHKPEVKSTPSSKLEEIKEKPAHKESHHTKTEVAQSKREDKSAKREENTPAHKPTKKEATHKSVAKEEPKSLFSKFTSVFKKKDSDQIEEKTKERPKMVVESIRATSDGKIIEEKTIIQTKTLAQEEEDERIEAQQKATQEKEALEIAQREEQDRERKERSSKLGEPEKKSFFAKLTQVITTKTISQSQFEELFFDLEMAMLENNVAVQVIEKLKEDLQKNIVGVALKRGEIETIIVNTLRDSITDVLSIKVPNLLQQVDSKKPYVIAFIGVNGAGKTTNLAKVANYLKKNGKTVVIGACDTFRAAAIQQLEEHANRLDIKIIKHDYGADAAAVAFDAVAHAKAKGIDVVLIDTAGRLHSNSNLMDELAKIERVIQPDLKLFVGESVTGNDCIEQAMQFNEKIGIDGIILSKADVDEKGGAAISVSYVTKKPIYFIGTGQTYDDLEPFSKEKVLASLEL